MSHWRIDSSGFCGKFLESKRITRVNTGGQWTKISTIWDLQVATCYPNTSMSIKSLTCRSRSIDIAANLTVNLVDSETSEQANTVGLFSPLQTLLKIEMTNSHVNATEKLIDWLSTLTLTSDWLSTLTLTYILQCTGKCPTENKLVYMKASSNCLCNWHYFKRKIFMIPRTTSWNLGCWWKQASI